MRAGALDGDGGGSERRAPAREVVHGPVRPRGGAASGGPHRNTRRGRQRNQREQRRAGARPRPPRPMAVTLCPPPRLLGARPGERGRVPETSHSTHKGVSRFWRLTACPIRNRQKENRLPEIRGGFSGKKPRARSAASRRPQRSRRSAAAVGSCPDPSSPAGCRRPPAPGADQAALVDGHADVG